MPDEDDVASRAPDLAPGTSVVLGEETVTLLITGEAAQAVRRHTKDTPAQRKDTGSSPPPSDAD